RRIEPPHLANTVVFQGTSRTPTAAARIEHPAATGQLRGDALAAVAHAAQHGSIKTGEVAAGDSLGIIAVGQAVKFLQQIFGYAIAPRQLDGNFDSAVL